jgi:hypothetical protein
MRRPLMELIAAIQASGGAAGLADLFAWLVAHKEEIVSIVTLLLTLFGVDLPRQATDISVEECKTKLVELGCSEQDADTLATAL